MSRKDYELVAKCIVRAREIYNPAQADMKRAADIALNWAADRLASGFSADNPRFDSARFLRACRGGDK